MSTNNAKNTLLTTFTQLFAGLNIFGNSGDTWLQLVSSFLSFNSVYLKSLNINDTINDIVPENITDSERYRQCRQKLGEILTRVLDTNSVVDVSILPKFTEGLSHIPKSTIGSNKSIQIMSMNVNGQQLSDDTFGFGLNADTSFIHFFQEHKEPSFNNNNNNNNIIFQRDFGMQHMPHPNQSVIQKKDGKYGQIIVYSKDFQRINIINPTYWKQSESGAEYGCRSSPWLILKKDDKYYAVISVHVTSGQRAIATSKRLGVLKSIISDVDDLKFAENKYIVVIAGDFNIRFDSDEYQQIISHIGIVNEKIKKYSHINIQAGNTPTNVNLNHEDETGNYGIFRERIDYVITAGASYTNNESVIMNDAWLNHGFDHGIIVQNIKPLNDIEKMTEQFLTSFAAIETVFTSSTSSTSLPTSANMNNFKLPKLPKLPSSIRSCTVSGLLFRSADQKHVFLDYNQERSQYNFRSVKNAETDMNLYLKQILCDNYDTDAISNNASCKVITYGKEGINAAIYLIIVNDQDLKSTSGLTRVSIQDLKQLHTSQTAERLKKALDAF